MREPAKVKSESALTPIARADIEKYRVERRGLEVDYLDEVLESRKRAWIVATGFGVLAGVCVIAVLGVVLRYSQPIPEHMLTINKDTGEVQEVSLVRGEKTYGDVVDSFWIAQYVVHHESYDFYAAQGDYDAIGLMSTNDVADEFRVTNAYGTSTAVDKRLGDSENTRVHVTSVITDAAHGVSTIRYTTTKKFRTRPLPEPPQYWIATIGYRYVVRPMTASQRYINPLGFQVTSFRTNAESAGRVGG
jgi:type IV secretion system protein VirB8